MKVFIFETEKFYTDYVYSPASFHTQQHLPASQRFKFTFERNPFHQKHAKPNRGFLLAIRLLIVIFPFGIACPGYGQSFNAIITGTVKDSASKPVPFATIVLVLATDSTAIKSTTCNAEGHYYLPIKKAGKYWLTVSAIGYKKPPKQWPSIWLLHKPISKIFCWLKKTKTLQEVKSHFP